MSFLPISEDLIFRRSQQCTFLSVLQSPPTTSPFPSSPCPQVSLLIRRELTERAKDFSLILDDVAITELSFSREYTAAVEAKQVGELPEE